MSAANPTAAVAPPVAEPPPPLTAERSAYVRAMSHVLLGGVLLSAGILAIGVAALFVHGPGVVNTGPIAFSFDRWLQDLSTGQPDAIFLLGLVVLVLTPLTRVLISVTMFVHDRDRPFIAITLFVLAMLLVSAVAGVRL